MELLLPTQSRQLLGCTTSRRCRGAAAAPALGARQGLHPALQHIKSRALLRVSLLSSRLF